MTPRMDESTVQSESLTLDEAWAAAEAAVPKAGWQTADGRWFVPSGAWSITVEWISSGDGYFEPYEEGYRATARIGPLTTFGAVENAPAAALQVLAAVLHESEARDG